MEVLRTITRRIFLAITAFILVLSSCSGAVHAASTEIHIIRYAADGVTVLAERTVDYRWMEANLPVMGDGTTHYFLQGPVFVDDPDPEREKELRWNPEEDINVQEKDMGAVKGTNLRDLCDLVGGMSSGEELRIVAMDGFKKSFGYENIYEYSSRQGPMVITWWCDANGYVPEYQDGMRLIFFADTSTNPWGIHAMGVWDWHESAEEKYWYYYVSGNEWYPTTTGLSGKYISRIEIFSDDEPCGNLTVTSTPSGAEILLDDDATGFSTPHTFTCLPEGSYLVRVELEGYQPSREEWAEIYHQSESRIDLTLIPELPVVPGGYSSSDSETREPGGTLNTHVLVPYATGVPAIVAVSRAEGDTRTISGDTGAVFTILPGQSGMTRPFLTSLYVFVSNCTGNAVPVVSAEGTVLEPEMVYAAIANEPLRAATLAFNVTPVSVDGFSLMISSGEKGSTCLVRPPLLVSYYQDPGSRSWVLEGADLVSVMETGMRADPGNTTRLVFDGIIPGAVSANLTIFSTIDEEIEEPSPVLIVNGMPVSGSPARQQDTLLTAYFPVLEVPKGSSIAEISWNAPATGGYPVEPRLAILTLSYPVRNVTPLTPEPDTTSALTVIATGTPEAEVTLPGEPGPGEELPFPESLIQGFWDLVFWFSSLFSPEMVNETPGGLPGPEPAVPSQTVVHEPEITGYALEIQVIPEGATLSINGITLDTPAPSTVMLPEGVHTIGAEHEGYLGCLTSIMVDQPGSITLVLVPEPSTEGDGQPSAPDVHHGGLYVTSYPKGMTLTIDNKEVDGKTPLILNGVKRGSHILKATRVIENGMTDISITERVWLSAGSISIVEFDFISPECPRQIRVENPDGDRMSFTANGRYPVLQAPVILDLTHPDAFITLIGDEHFTSVAIPNGLADGSIFVIPSYEGDYYSLRVETAPPGAMVSMDGIATESATPALISGLSEGSHRVSVYLPGYLPEERIVVVARDNEAVIVEPARFVLETYPSGPLGVESIPPGAWITLDGVSTGEKTPFSFEYLPIGIHELTLEFDSREKSRDIIIRPDNANRYVMAMQ